MTASYKLGANILFGLSDESVTSIGYNYRVDLHLTGYFTDFTLSGFSYKQPNAALLHCTAAK
jgi:hypothetical protein